MQVKGLRVWAPVVLVLAAACGSEPPAPGTPPAGALRVDESKAGTLTGRVLIDGDVPVNAPVKMASDPFCIRENTDAKTYETFVVADGGLDNVFVWVKDGLGNYQFDVPTEPVKVDQQGCRYVPHVFGVRAGQPLEVSNSDDTLHNVNARGDVNRAFNVGQFQRGMTNTVNFTAPEVMIPFKCDVHPWMSAYAGVVAHPYFAVTKGGGQFQMAGLPAGTYTIEAWHEKLGTQTQTVTLGERESKAISFTFTLGTSAVQ